MSRRRPRVRYSELTSLLDVLFIVLFAALVHAASLVAKAREAPEKREATAKAPAAAAPARVAPRPPTREAQPRRSAEPKDLARARRMAAEAVVARSAAAGLVRATVSPTGRITRLQVERGADRRDLSVDLPLLERVPDPDVGLAYLGQRVPAMRACTAIRRALGGPDLGGALVLLAPERPHGDLSVALVEGLRDDALRCYADERGLAVLLPAPLMPSKDAQ